MFFLVNLPAKLISIVEGNISPREIAAGVCLGAFLGFIPLNGPMALLLALFFFFLRINRVATLLTLPLFKAAYLLGVYKLADITGAFLLQEVGFLAGFWRWVTHLPVIAYLDVNNTLVAGGLAVAAVLSIPIYFASKAAAAFLIKKYAKEIKNSPVAKLIPGLKLAGLVGDGAGATLKNVKTQVTLNIKAKISEAMARRRGPRKPNAILKRINLVRLTFVLIALLVFHFGVGFFVSPALSSLIVEGINKYSSARITIERVNVWPLTLSFSLKGMKIFDPEKPDLRIARIDDSSISVSPFGLLSKRLIFSNIHMKGAEINLEGTSDGGFNLSRLGKGKAEPASGGSDWRAMWQKKDTFGKIYETIKKHFAGKTKEKVKAERAAAKKVTTTVEDLPKGKLIRFKAARDMYLFEIRKLDISDAYVKIVMNGQAADLKDADIRLGQIAYDPENGTKIGLIGLKGSVEKDGAAAGNFDIYFSQSADRTGRKAAFKAALNDIDMDAVRFVYEDSLPVRVVKGKITLRSRTSINAGAIDSRNDITLKDQVLEAKGGGMMGFVPMPVVCNAINGINPLRLKFDIEGALDKPEFKGFQESLMALIKPYIADVQENFKNEGLKALGRLFEKKQ